MFSVWVTSCFILIVIYVSCCILFHFPCIIVFDWFQLFSVTQVFSLIPDCPLCLHVTGKWFLYSAFLLYLSTRNAFYSMSNSPIHTHIYTCTTSKCFFSDIHNSRIESSSRFHIFGMETRTAMDRLVDDLFMSYSRPVCI